MFLIGIGIGYLLIKEFPGSNVSDSVVQKKSVISEITLPKDVAKVQECADRKGSLFINPQDIPTGPLYMVSNNKVIGLEYVVKQDELAKGKTYDFLSALDIQVNHMNISSIKQGYDGTPGPFAVIDLYLVPKEVEQNIICPAPSFTPDATPSAELASPSAGLNEIPILTPIALPKLSPTKVQTPLLSPTP
jgi:hypothetical protein